MSLFRSPRGARALALVVSLSTVPLVRAADFVWAPSSGSDSQWTNPLNWTSAAGGAPGAGDVARFTQLSPPSESPIIKADADPLSFPPASNLLTLAGITADGYFDYTVNGAGQTDWRIELARFSYDVEIPPNLVSASFTLDVGGGDGIVRLGHFVEPPTFLDPAIAIPGGLIITGRSIFDGIERSASVGFRGTLDIKHGRLTLQDINYDDHDALTTLGGIVDSRDDLSYIPQRLPTAELFIDHSHFDSSKTRGLLIGSIGKANVSIANQSVLSNLKELRVGGNSSLNQASHELSSLHVTDSQVTVGDGNGGGVYIGDRDAPDLIDVYNGTLNLTRSTLSPSVIKDELGATIGLEPLTVQVGNFGAGRLVMDDASTLTARQFIAGRVISAFGEIRLNASTINVIAPAGEQTADHAGLMNIGPGGFGAIISTGTTTTSSAINARTLMAGQNADAFGDIYMDRNSQLTLIDSAQIGVNGQGRLTLTGRYADTDLQQQRNTYHTTHGTIGIRPGEGELDPNRGYRVTVGKVWGAGGFLVIGEGATLDVTDQPLTGLDQTNEAGEELWRTTSHALSIGNEGLGSFTVHADGKVRSESLFVGELTRGVGHVVLDKAMINTSSANMAHAIPGTVSISRTTTIGVNGLGTLDVKGPYVPRQGLVNTENQMIVDTFNSYGLLTASLTLGDEAGSNGTARAREGGQIRVNGTLEGERDLLVGRHGIGAIDISDSLVLSADPVPLYLSGATGGTVVVETGSTFIGGADSSLFPSARGTLTVHPNGLFVAHDVVLGGESSTNDSFISRAGATAQVNLPGGGTEMRTFAGGTVRVNNLELRGASVLAIESNPIIVADGELRDGGFHVEDDVDVLGGTLRLGIADRSSTGTLKLDTLHLDAGRLIGGGTIDGDLHVDGGTIAIQINGSTRFTGFDAFDLTGAATFEDGSVIVEAGTYVGAIGEQFDIIRFAAGTRTTSFTVTNPLASAPGTQWVSFRDADSLTLAVAGADGDTNFDGAVDFDDLLALAQHYGGSGFESWITGDFDDDLDVDFDDLLALAQNYGTSLLAEPTTTGSFESDWALAQSMVPEPTAIAAVGLLAVPLTRRSRRLSLRSKC